MKLEQVQKLRDQAFAEAQTLYAQMETEGRLPNEEENVKIVALEADIKKYDAFIATKKAHEALKDVVTSDVPAEVEHPLTSNAVDLYSKNAFGCKTLIDFLMKAKPDHHEYPKLVQYTNAASSVGTDGGVLIPTVLSTDIVAPSFAPASNTLLSRVNAFSTRTPYFKIKVSENTREGLYSIVQFPGEAGQADAADIHWADVRFELQKAQAKVQVSEHLTRFVPEVEADIRRQVAAGFESAMDYYILKGSGEGCPLGLLKSPGAVTITRDTALKVVDDDINAMAVRMQPFNYSKAYWIMNLRIQNELRALTQSGTVSGVAPLFMPQGGYSASPYDTLLGRPILYNGFCATTGTIGDFFLAQLGDYYFASLSANPEEKISTEVRWNYDQTELKFTWWVDGKHILRTAAANPDGSADTLSSLVLLGTKLT